MKKKSVLTKLLAIIIAVIVLVIVVVLGLSYLQNNSNRGQVISKESSVVDSVADIGEIALVQLGIVDIYSTEQATYIPYIGSLIGSERKKFLRVEFDAKLGIDGNRVVITPLGNNNYEVKIPPFIFIGFDNLKSEVAAENNGILSWTNPQIDSTDMINEIFSDANKKIYLGKYHKQLEDSARVFFTQLIRAIDPDAKLTFVFST